MATGPPRRSHSDVAQGHFADSRDVGSQLAALERDGFGAEARAAFADLTELLARLRLIDRGRLGMVNSRNHARAVTDAQEQRLVLKLTVVDIGDEAAVLTAWHAAGLAGLTPAVVASGRSTSGWSWTLQQQLPGSVPALDRGSDLLPAAAHAATQLHLPAATSPSCPLVDLLLRRRLRAGGGSPRLRRISESAASAIPPSSLADSRLLHGDFAANNLCVDHTHVSVFDPCGLVGSAAYDLARYVARSCVDAPIGHELARAASAYRAAGGTVNDRDLDIYTAAELCDVARWAQRPMSSGHHFPPRDDETALDAAEALLAGARPGGESELADS